MTFRRLAAALAVVTTFATPVHGQAPQSPEPDGPLRVYLDCATWNCREERYRQDITWVTWVREPQDAQVYILLTGQRAGNGGLRYTFDFEGRGTLAGTTDRYSFTSNPTDVEEETVAGLIQTISAGLVRYAALSGRLEQIRIEGAPVDEATAREPQQRQGDDPWNFWVFSARFNAEIQREDREEQDEFEVNLSANRTTDLWKVDLGARFDYRRREVTFDDDEDPFVDEREDWRVDAQVVRSLGPHWSVGFISDVGKSVRFNEDFSFELSPAVEWNYFPWQESTRRRLVANYSIGVAYVEYDEVPTIYEKSEETLLQHRLDIAYRQQESWGQANLGAELQQYLQYTDQYSIELQANVEYRLIRGLGLDVGVGYEVIRDQRFLSAEGLTPEEILISRRELQTGSRFSFEVGLNYRFGSIFNTVVNQRFPGLN
ncbi:MAG TPA: hypothetical protein VK858_20920 [Longimicrobiales bacterium]|nr:hypothetical protein [Longimicrobiales bacterium]